MTLRIGDRVDDFTFQRPDGSAVALSAFDGKALVLIFLRHLA
jgi:peroxiredoxin